MPGRARLVSTLWLSSTLALLASVLVSLIPTSGFVNVSSLPDCLRCDLALPPSQATAHLSGAMATDVALEMNALPPENEEQDRADALDEPRVPFLILCSFRKVPNLQASDLRSCFSLYPLRC